MASHRPNGLSEAQCESIFRGRWLLGIFVLLVVGCGPGSSPDAGPTDGGAVDASSSDGAVDPTDAGTITLEVAVGNTAETFSVLEPGQTVTAVFGTQGGYHLDMGFRVRGLTVADFSSGEWIIAYQARGADGTVFTEPITRLLTLGGIGSDGVGQIRFGDRVFLSEPDPTPRDLTTVTLSVSLTRTDGARAEDSEDVVLDIPFFP